jgi:hypothetical protein
MRKTEFPPSCFLYVFPSYRALPAPDYVVDTYAHADYGHCPPSSETCNSRSFGWTRFENWQQPGNFQRLPQVRAEITKLEDSAFGFCLSMHFDESAEARAVNIIDLFQINDNPCGAGCEEIVDHCKHAAALLPEHKTPFERQKVDSIHLTLRYFQRHRLPPQGPLRGFAMHP